MRAAIKVCCFLACVLSSTLSASLGAAEEGRVETALHEESSRAKHARRMGLLSYFTLGAGSAGGGRSFRHREPATGEVRAYRANRFAGVALSLEVTPPDFVRAVSWSVEADFWHSVAFKSYSRRERRVVRSPSSRYGVLVAVRLRPFEGARLPRFKAGAGFGAWDLDFDIPSAPDLEVPTGRYRFLRGMIGAEVPFSPFTLFAEAAFLLTLDAGPLGNRDIEGKPLGTESTLGTRVRVLPFMELALRGSYTLFVGELGPLPGRSLAAGFVDEYLTLSLLARATFRGL